MNNKVKHIDVGYHFIRRIVFENKLELINIDGKLNPDSALTKVIPLESFLRHRAK